MAKPVPNYVIHGTMNCYNNYGCRCPECIQVNREYKRNWYRVNRGKQ